ncbi:unnamed protein product, partial [Rotaria sp. Silwood1]
MFFEVALASPQQIAIEFNEQTWTYGELLMNVINVARHLQIEIGDIVYQYVDRSLEMVCGLLGIMCAGGAYCPLSPTDPPMYVRALTDEIQGRCVLVHENTRDLFSNTISKQIQMISLEHILLVGMTEEVAEKKMYVESNSSSCIICTSGTTGRQKIIVHTHVSLIAGIHNLMIWDTKHGDKVLQVVASSWVIHLFEILMPLVIIPSGTLVLLPPGDNLNMTRFCKTIEEKQITVLFINQSLLKVLLDYLELNNIERNEIFKRVRILWISGESPKIQYLVKIKSFSLQTRIFLIFSMSETNAAIGREIEENIDELTDLSIVPIGFPLAKYRCLLVDESIDGEVISSLETNRIGQIYLADTCRCWSSLPFIPYQSYSNSHDSIMNQHRLTTANNNINMTNKKIFHTSLPTVINISKEDSHIDETDRFLNEHSSSNNLSDLPDSCNLEERVENKLLFPGFVEKAFYCLRQTTPLRYQCLKLITWPWFERISIIVILLNCITLGMYQPCAHHTNIESSKKCDTTLCIWLQAIDYFVFAFFTIEMCIKMIAMGIFGKRTYLAESWNQLDCFIVLTGLVEFLIPGDHVSLSAIRTVRVLRPLRVINRVPSMRILVMLLLDTLPMLGNVLLLCFFIFFIFGIIGVQLWKGLLRNRCFLQLNSTVIDHYAIFDDFPFQSFYIPSDQDSFICSDSSSSGMTKCSEIPQFRQDNMICKLDIHSLTSSLTNKTINGCINWNQYYQLCAISDKNPFSGSISFDNIGLSWLAIFQIITLENWISIMYYIQDAHSFWDWIYFVCLIVIGSFFMMNLCLAVISTQFSITKKRETEKMLVEQKRFSRSTTTLTNEQQGSCWEEIIKYFQRLLKRVYKRFETCWKYCRQKHDKTNQRHHRNVTTPKKILTSNVLSTTDDKIISSTPLINQNHRSNCRHHQSQSLLVLTPLSKSIDYGTGNCDISPDVIASTSANNNSLIEKNLRKDENFEFERQEQIERNDICDCYYQDEIVNTFENSQEEEEREKSKFRQKSEICCCCCCSCFTIIKKLISRFVASKYFDRIIFSAIIMNTFSMSVEYHGQPQLLTNILEYSNTFFIILFTIEMLFKIIAKGCLKYIKNPFNLFDGGIVLISLIELYGAKNSGLSVLRTFRLLRVLKLVRFMPTLRRQL